MALSEPGLAMILVQDPTSAPESDLTPPQALHAEVTVVGALAFFAAMTLAGWAIGRVLGDEYQLVPGLTGAESGLSDEQALNRLETSLQGFEKARPAEGIDELITAISGPKQVGYLFSEGRMIRLLRVLDRPASSWDPSQRDFLPQVYRLLGRIGSVAEPKMQVDVVGTMCLDLANHKRLAHQLLSICRKKPDLWNDVAGALETIAADDVGVSRLLEQKAGNDQDWVARANDSYMTDMTRFRRLAEDRGVIGTKVVDWELNTMLDHEFAFLKASGGTSKRFVWIAPEIRRLIDLFDDERLELLHGATRRGNPDTSSVLGQLVLAWARGGFPKDIIQETIDLLGESASEHVAAADALVGIFQNIRSKDGTEPSQIQKRTRRHAFDALLAASEESYEVLALLATHGIHANMYEDDSDEPSKRAPVHEQSADPLRMSSSTNAMSEQADIEVELVDIDDFEPTDPDGQAEPPSA